MMKHPAVYILTNKKEGTLYIGVTSNLTKRISEHKSHAVKGFSDKYNLERLVWAEQHETMESAITREKQLKKWNRDWKVRIIEEQNPTWKDLSDEIV